MLSADPTIPYAADIEDQPRRRRGRPAVLTESQIAEAALKLSNAVQFENLTMRALAEELGVGVMTIYNYVESKNALFDLISDHLLRPIVIPSAETGSWEERMRVLQRNTRAAVGRHVGLGFRGGVGQSTEAARLVDGVMEILSAGGFDSEQADFAFATLFTFMLGQIELDALMSAGGNDDAGSITPARNRDELFEFGFDVVLDGLKRRLKPKSR